MATRSQMKRLRKKLVSIAKSKNPRIAYGAVDHIVGLNVAIPRHRWLLGAILADIGAKERLRGRPFLPAVVVRKHSRRPGPGFYAEARGHYPRYRHLSDLHLHDAVLADVVACTRW